MNMNKAEAGQIAGLVRTRVEAVGLDLSGSLVITEAATAAYSSTAAGAALAGAEVWSFARDTPFGSRPDAVSDVTTVAKRLGVADSISFVDEREDLPFERADIVTNSGVLRPIAASDLRRMKPTSVIALMYEGWEARDSDVDFTAATACGIEVIGVNEKHDYCGAFEYLGPLVLHALERRAWLVDGPTIGILSDNAFSDPVTTSLREEGLNVVDAGVEGSECDIVVVATTPSSAGSRRAPDDVTRMVLRTGASGCVVLWGDVDYPALESRGVTLEPERPPVQGHQGIGMHEVGPEPVVRLQIGGLTAVTYRDATKDDPAFGLAQRHVRDT